MHLTHVANTIASRMRTRAIELSYKNIEAALSLSECYGTFLRSNYIHIFSDSAFEKHFCESLDFLLKSAKKKF